MATAVLEDYYENLTISGCILAAFLNLFAVPLSIRMSKYSLGSFKIIMLVFSTNNMFHMLTDIVILPLYLFTVYSSGPIHYLGSGFAAFGGIWACVIFMLQILLETLHFLYRYVVLCRSEYIHLLSVRNVCKILSISYLVYFSLFTAVFTFLTGYNDEIYEAIGNGSLERVGLPARELNGVVVYYMRKNAQGDLSIYWKGCLGMLCVMGANTSLIAVMIYCGYKIHSSTKKIASSAQMSRGALEMNRTLFKMLVAQTVVPILLLHAPCAFLLVGPFFWEIGKPGELLIIAVLSYSIFEPLIVVYFLAWKRIKRLILGGNVSTVVPSYRTQTRVSKI